MDGVVATGELAVLSLSSPTLLRQMQVQIGTSTAMILNWIGIVMTIDQIN